MASTSSDSPPPVADFIRRVSALSGGSVQIQVINQWGDYAPSSEAQDAYAVAAGTVDLGWAGSEVFDTLGVPGFRALSAPMLIDSYPLENAILNSSVPAWMLAGLSTVHLTGLAVLGDALRRPVAVHRPLLAPADWHGLSIGTYRSGVQEQAIRAPGAARWWPSVPTASTIWPAGRSRDSSSTCSGTCITCRYIARGTSP